MDSDAGDKRAPTLRHAGEILALAAVYAIAGRTGLLLNAVSGFATLVWPPTGFALAALLLRGYRLWPGVFLGALIVNVLTGAPLPAALGIATGNTLEAVLGVYALRRIPGFQPSLRRLIDVVGVILLAGATATMVSATIGVASLYLSGIVSRAVIRETWSAWWLGDLIGAILLAPLILVWTTRPRPKLSRPRLFEVALSFGAILIVGLFFFGSETAVFRGTLGRGYVFFPMLIWATTRFGLRGATSGIFLVSVLAVWGTVTDHGPFAGPSLTSSLFALQTFMAVAAGTFLVFGVVIEERRRAETELRDAHGVAAEANRAKAEFLAVMSHELRTPLNAISGYSEMLSMGLADPLTTKQADAVMRIRRNQQHLLLLINQVLDFAKLEAGQTTIDARAVCVREVLDTLEPLVRPQLEAKRIALTRCDVDPSLVASANPPRLRQILLNFLTNGIKFTPEEGRVSIAATRIGDVVEFTVSDTGIGIPADKLEKVFEPFYQVESGPTRRFDGVGLGLAISRDIARKMGGDVSIASTVGVGSRVTLVLPVYLV